MTRLSRMMREIEEEVTLTRHLIGKDTLNPRVLDAMRKVPRDRFVPSESKAYAYENGPVPIGYGQTISQPYIVALMTDLLDPESDDIVLEIGTGSCYQAAVLSLLVKRVYTVEIIAELAEQARERLMRLCYANVEVRAGDGYHGWPEHAPYDGIIVTAAAPYLPKALLDQLRPGGRMVIPIGLPYRHQELMLVEKDKQGQIETRSILDVAFVPLTGDSMIEPERESVTRIDRTNEYGWRTTMTAKLSDAQINELKLALKSRYRDLREEIRQELLSSDNEQYIDLAGQVHDMEEESVADLLVDLNLAIIDRHIRELQAIDAALLRIANNEYGICIECEGEIGYPRLKVNPAALRCHDCQERYEHTHAATSPSL